RNMSGATRGPSPNRKDRTDDAVDVEVGRTIDGVEAHDELRVAAPVGQVERLLHLLRDHEAHVPARLEGTHDHFVPPHVELLDHLRSEEHTSELQSRFDLVCRLLLEKKKKKHKIIILNANNFYINYK